MSELFVANKDFANANTHTKHFITTSKGGFSSDNYGQLNLGMYCKENALITSKNRFLLCDKLGITPQQLYVPREIHKSNIVTIDKRIISLDEKEKAKTLMEADALITKEHNIAIAVSTADCVPILCTDNKNFVAAIHAGWRGIVANIIDETIKELAAMKLSKESLSFMVGPCIAGISYEVGLDVWKQFENSFNKEELDSILVKQNGDKYFPDIRIAANIQLKRYVNEDKIFNFTANTFTDCRFYSVRRNGPNTGRFLTGIMLTDE